MCDRALLRGEVRFAERSAKPQLLEGWLTRKVEPRKIEKAKALIRKRGPLVLAGSRFIPGIRSILVLIAGTSGMRFLLAVIPITISAVAWYLILTVAGSVLGNNMEAAEGFMRQFEIWIWILLGVIIGTIITFKVFSRKRR